MSQSSKLEARLAEIQSLAWSDEEKERASQLAITNADTFDSVTAGGRYHPQGLSDGDYIQPRYPGREETVNQRAMREDATDHS